MDRAPGRRERNALGHGWRHRYGKQTETSASREKQRWKRFVSRLCYDTPNVETASMPILNSDPVNKNVTAAPQSTNTIVSTDLIERSFGKSSTPTDFRL